MLGGRARSPRVGCLVSAAAACIASLCVASRAHAEAGDGAYGRLEGDMTLVTGLGASVIPGEPGGASAYGTADVRMRYLDAVGAVVQYEEGEAFRRVEDYGAIRRAFYAGVEIRPLFPIRFLQAMEKRRFDDLVLDSIGLELASIWTARAGNDTQRPGFLVGLGFEIPFFGQANGLWARVATSMRWSAERLEGASAASDPGGRVITLSLGLAWHQVLRTHAVEAGDERVY
jgi:hypothetical protein